MNPQLLIHLLQNQGEVPENSDISEDLDKYSLALEAVLIDLLNKE